MQLVLTLTYYFNIIFTSQDNYIMSLCQKDVKIVRISCFSRVSKKLQYLEVDSESVCKTSIIR